MAVARVTKITASSSSGFDAAVKEGVEATVGIGHG